MAAADISDDRAPLQLRVHAFECGVPLADEVGGVTRAEEALRPRKQVRVVLVPSKAVTGGEG